MNELYQRDIELLNTYPLLMGVDEAGRGALAGPVVCAAVILDYGEIIEELNDSKQVTPRKRDRLYDAVLANAQAFQVIAIPPDYIDEHNILQATLEGMRQAITAILPESCLCLVDGNQLPWSVGDKSIQSPSSMNSSKQYSDSSIVRIGMRPSLKTGSHVESVFDAAQRVTLRSVISGDALHACIAAASILAKVTRDRLMIDLHDSFPHYGFDSHKGYGTASHLKAIREHGPSENHRNSFAPIRDLLQIRDIFRG